MKYFYNIFILFFTFTISFGQINWTKYDSNPVMSGSGGWQTHILGPMVLYNADSSRYEMWFNASLGETDWRPYSIGFATSPDGMTWSVYPDPVLEPEAGSWDEYSADRPVVLLEDGQYRMWYTSWYNNQWIIGYTTSPNGINWTKHDPITIDGHSGGYRFGYILPVEGGGYEMWFGSQGNAFFYATSEDGINWVKGNDNQPVLTAGAEGQWDDTEFYAPYVILLEDGYHMWYTGAQDPEVNLQIGYATSPDGKNWVKYNNPQTDELLYEESDPVLVPGPDLWDNWLIESGSAIITGDTLRMWYVGISDGTTAKIGLATAPLSILGVPGKYSTIQEGIDAANSGDVVLVDEGTYYENINFKGKAITVASRFWFDGDSSHIEKTIIDGSQPANPDQGSVVSFTHGEDTTSVLCGFTIRGGTGTITNFIGYTFRFGGGVQCYEAGAKLVRNHIIQNHCSSGNYSWGGGVCAVSESTSPPNLVLQDNRITDNKVTVEDISTYPAGGGVEIWNVTARIEGNLFARDSAIGASGAESGALYIRGDPGIPSAIIKNNSFIDNVVYGSSWAAVGGAVFLLSTDEVLVENNEFIRNKAICGSGAELWVEGGAICIDDQNITGYGRKLILNNRFVGNSVFSEDYTKDRITGGGGIFIHSTFATISGNTIIDNSSGSNNANNVPSGAGIYTYESRFTIENNIISGNRAVGGMGGGIFINRAQPDISVAQSLHNNTIYNNQSQSYGGGVTIRYGAKVNVMNNIIFDNRASRDEQLFREGGSVAHVNYNDIEDGYEGTGNIDKDPKFLGEDDFHLSDYSPCIGAGMDSLEFGGSWYGAPAFDKDGKPRPNPQGSMLDIGAYESPRDTPLVDAIENDDLNIPLKYFLGTNFPNPFNPKTMISYQLPMSSDVELSIYNILGQKLAKLVDKKQLAGNYQVQWDASGFASGIYIYQLTAKGQLQNAVFTKKLVLLK